MQFEIVYSLLECFISGAGRCFLVVLYELANGLKSEEMYVSGRELITDSISMREVISSLYVTLARPIVFLHLTALSTSPGRKLPLQRQPFLSLVVMITISC